MSYTIEISGNYNESNLLLGSNSGKVTNGTVRETIVNEQSVLQSSFNLSLASGRVLNRVTSASSKEYDLLGSLKSSDYCMRKFSSNEYVYFATFDISGFSDFDNKIIAENSNDYLTFVIHPSLAVEVSGAMLTVSQLPVEDATKQAIKLAFIKFDFSTIDKGPQSTTYNWPPGTDTIKTVIYDLWIRDNIMYVFASGIDIDIELEL